MKSIIKRNSINHPFPSIEKKSRVQDSQIQSQMLKLLEPNSNNGAETEKKRTRENSPARWGKCSNRHTTFGSLCKTRHKPKAVFNEKPQMEKKASIFGNY